MRALQGDFASRLLWGETPYEERNADLSPDGHWLAYESDKTGQVEVWVRPFPNVNDGEWQVSSDGGAWPLWNPDDSSELFFVGPEAMMAVAVETEPAFRWEEPGRLFETGGYATPANSGTTRRIDVSRDGKRFLMFKVKDAGGGVAINVILNWAEELTRLVPVS